MADATIQRGIAGRLRMTTPGSAWEPGLQTGRSLLNRLVHIHDRYVRDGHYFGDNIIGDIHTARLLRARLDVSDVKCGANQTSVAQGDFGDAVANTDNPDRLQRSDLEREWLNVPKCHRVQPSSWPRDPEDELIHRRLVPY